MKKIQKEKLLATFQVVATLGIAIMIFGAQFNSPAIPADYWKIVVSWGLVIIGSIIVMAGLIGIMKT